MVIGILISNEGASLQLGPQKMNFEEIVSHFDQIDNATDELFDLLMKKIPRGMALSGTIPISKSGFRQAIRKEKHRHVNEIIEWVEKEIRPFERTLRVRIERIFRPEIKPDDRLEFFDFIYPSLREKFLEKGFQVAKGDDGYVYFTNVN